MGGLAVLDCNEECGGDAVADCEGTCGGSADCGGGLPDGGPVTGDAPDGGPATGGAPGGGGMWIHPPAEGVKKLCFAYSEADPGNMVQRVCGEGGPGEDGNGGEDGKDGEDGEDGKDGKWFESKPDIEFCWMIDSLRNGAAVPIADCPDQEDNRIHCYDEHENRHSCPNHPSNWDYDSNTWAP